MKGKGPAKPDRIGLG